MGHKPPYSDLRQFQLKGLSPYGMGTCSPFDNDILPSLPGLIDTFERGIEIWNSAYIKTRGGML